MSGTSCDFEIWSTSLKMVFYTGKAQWVAPAVTLKYGLHQQFILFYTGKAHHAKFGIYCPPPPPPPPPTFKKQNYTEHV